MQYLTIGISSLGPLALLIIIAVGAAPGRGRTFGIIGSVLALLGTISSNVISLAFPLLLERFNLSVSAYSYLFIPIQLVHIVALVLLALAVVTASRDRARAPQPTSPDYR